MTSASSDSSSQAAVIRTRLRQLFDPELGLNVVDLGLIREIEVVGTTATVTMTLTSPGCPIGEVLVEGVRSLITATPGITNAIVHLVWNPPWSPSHISPTAQATLNSTHPQ